MDSTERKVLEYLKDRDWIALGAILSECSGAPHDNDAALRSLHRKGFVEYKKYFGSGNTDFYKPSEKGNRIFQSSWRKNMEYLASHWTQLITILFSASILAISLHNLFMTK